VTKIELTDLRGAMRRHIGEAPPIGDVAPSMLATTVCNGQHNGAADESVAGGRT